MDQAPVLDSNPTRFNTSTCRCTCVQSCRELVQHVQFTSGSDNVGRAIGAILVVMPISILCNFACVVLNRWALRWSAGLTSFTKIFAVILLNCLLTGMLTFGLLVLDPFFRPFSRDINHLFRFVLVLSNIMTLIITLTFVILTFVALIHRLFWPLSSETWYCPAHQIVWDSWCNFGWNYNRDNIRLVKGHCRYMVKVTTISLLREGN